MGALHCAADHRSDALDQIFAHDELLDRVNAGRVLLAAQSAHCCEEQTTRRNGSGGEGGAPKDQPHFLIHHVVLTLGHRSQPSIGVVENLGAEYVMQLAPQLVDPRRESVTPTGGGSPLRRRDLFFRDRFFLGI